MDRAEYVKDIQRLRRNINRRLERISKPTNYGASNRAVSSYSNIEQPSTLRGKSVDELKSLRRQLLNFDQKQFSKVKGYEQYKKFENTFEDLDEDEAQRVWELYGKNVEEKRFLQRYKYEVLQTISEGVRKGNADKTIRTKINKQYKELLTDDEAYEQEQWEKFRNETGWRPKRLRNK